MANNYEKEILNSLNNIEQGVFTGANNMIAKNKNILNNARISNKFNISIPYTQTTASNTPIYTFQGDSRGNTIYSIAFNYDTTNTQPNYSFLYTIDGVDVDSGTPNSNNYSLFSASGGYNPIPEGIGIPLGANGTIKIYSYMSGSTSTNGSISISILSEVL